MIRKMKETDVEAVADIWLDTNIKAHDFIPAQYWKEQFPAVKEMLRQAEIYVYEADLFPASAGGVERICGFIGMSGEYIEGIFVRKDAQSRGAGRALTDYVKSVKGRLTLKVYCKNERAIKFYKREGFRIQEEGVDPATGEKEFTMIWRGEDK